MNKKISIWWLPVVFIAMGLLNQQCTNSKLKPLKEKAEKLETEIKTLEYEKDTLTTYFTNKIQVQTQAYNQLKEETGKKIEALQYKKQQYEKAITQYNNSDFDSKFELFANIIKKDSL